MAVNGKNVSPDDPRVAALRQELLGGKVTIPQIAAAQGTCERTVNNYIGRFRIPYEVLPGIGKVVDPKVYRERSTTKSNGDAPRGRGRPRKVAA